MMLHVSNASAWLLDIIWKLYRLIMAKWNLFVKKDIFLEVWQHSFWGIYICPFKMAGTIGNCIHFQWPSTLVVDKLIFFCLISILWRTTANYIRNIIYVVLFLCCIEVVLIWINCGRLIEETCFVERALLSRKGILFKNGPIFSRKSIVFQKKYFQNSSLFSRKALVS